MALGPSQPDAGGATLQAELGGHLSRARAAWPGVELDPRAYVEHLAAALSRGDEHPVTLAELHTDDLYIARACAGGDAQAIAACAARFGPEVRRGLGRLSLGQDEIDEVEQRLRERLFVRGAHDRPEIGDYAGRGRLGAWMRVVAVRLALRALGKRKREQPLDDQALHRLVTASSAAGGGPEQQHMKLLYRQEFKDAWRAAIVELSARDRLLLQQRFVDQQSIDEIGAYYDVHRATAARWLNRAQAALEQRLRRAVRAKLQLDDRGYESLVMLVRSQLDLSVQGLA